MRVAVSGTANVGKTTLISDFLQRWSSFKTPTGSYRDIITKNKETHSSNTTEQVQNDILDYMIDTQCQYEPEDNVIFDRCTLDNLIYTLWGVHKGNISSQYADRIIPIVKESFKHIDIIFIIKYTSNINIVDDGVRCVDADYIREIDAIFSMIYQDYIKGDENTYTMFPKDDMPALIEIGGSREQRIAQIADYIDVFGNHVETRPEESVLSDSQLKQMEALLKMQNQMNLEDKWSIN